ncbi:serine/threonine protein kinase [Actinosynnema mirum DSM 43827]|uniref:non-specific serine/threonine protein kinase n=1 Tax=Actinosynnema mirum (strain ATCC 29888 / DSM 43827 / JCM 3225 / NBRC 14064 / NCIMB 13271 / NRRL B-12336 / IMRU 3971 / 101) TaxID=446462 RepID=C6WD29_ACTMD|nr:serine/threonine protein kinase [Actinosynnema mirum DSM 43827]
MEDRTIADRYRLTERIGAGGMGVVWRAQDQRLHRVVAVKELRPGIAFDEAYTERAIREGRIAARLQHPNVIALYDVVEHDDRPWLIMEYLPSKSLAALLSERGRLPADETVRLGIQLASGLVAAHHAGVVHRDVKPGNVLVTEFGTVKITDFGTSRAADEVTMTASGLLIGTPAYLSPEVARGGRAEFPADVYGLGATLYAAVEGGPPFGTDANTIAMLHRVAEGKYAQPEHAGPLGPVLNRLLDVDPATRPTMTEAVRLLREVRPDSSPTAVVAAPAGTTVIAEPAVDALPAEAAAGAAAGAAAVAAAADIAQSTPQPTKVDDLAAAPAEPERAAEPEQRHPPTVVDEPATAFTPAPPTPYVPPRPQYRTQPDQPEEEGGGRKVLPIVALALATLVIATLVTYLVNQSGQDDQAVTPPPQTTVTTEVTGGEQPGGQDTGAGEQKPTSDTPSSPPAQSSSAPPPQTSTQEQPPPQQTAPVDQGLRDYYSLLPGNTEAGYARLTDNFKAGRAGTYQGYAGFWQTISSVSLTDVQVVGPNQVRATVVYNGGSRETNTFTLVQSNGQWLIDGQS